jgi:hypothetical protein
LWWQYIVAFLNGVAAVVGSWFAIRQIIKHEKQACDARIDAFKEGLDHSD